MLTAAGIKLPVAFSAAVAEGRKIGRKLGYPTANLAVEGGASPQIPHGVYAGWASVEGQRYLSIMSFGKAETVGASSVTFEVHLLDFQGGLYGKEMRVEVVRFLRAMEKFDSVELLKEAMEEDELCTRALFTSRQK